MTKEAEVDDEETAALQAYAAKVHATLVENVDAYS